MDRETKNEPLVAVDSMVLVWAIREDGTKEQLKWAKWLFQSLEQENAQIIIPAVCLAEYLTPIEEGRHREVTARLTKRFIIAPFDVRCASLAATLFVKGKAEREMHTENARKCLRADSLIIATAAVHNAEVFYSNDRDCRNLADGVWRMRAEDLPEIPPDLFSYEQDDD